MSQDSPTGSWGERIGLFFGCAPKLGAQLLAAGRAGAGRVRTLLTLAFVACLLGAGGQAAEAAPGFSLLNRSLPDFSVTDTAGRVVSSRSLTGRTTVLFVFCACDPCRAVADEWARRQHEAFFHQVPQGLASTLVVYAGEPAAAGAFARSVDFDRTSTVVASDPSMRVARRLRAMPCPSVYVVDSAGVVRYSSKELAPPGEASPSVLLGQTLNLLAALGGPGKSSTLDASPIIDRTEAGLRLTPVGGAGLEVIEDNGLLWHPDNLQATRISREFSFRNDNEVPVEVSQVQASCGCGAVTLSKKGRPVASAVANPGETLELTVAAEVGDGQVSRVLYAWLYSRALTPIGFVKIVLVKGVPR